MAIDAPFPYFGGKKRIASQVWERLGDTPNYIEPFFGSGAMLLQRPHKPRIETINDASGFVANFWRAVQHDPEAVAYHADNPVNENDLHARHSWLVNYGKEIVSRLEGDPEFYDAKVAGWWVWGMCVWIGSGFCSGKGPWVVQDGELVKGNAGKGVNRARVHLGDAGQGVRRSLVHLGDAGKGANNSAGRNGIYDWMQSLADRLRNTRVCCGDWSRICGDSPTIKNGLTAVFLDPPYSAEAGRDNNLYEVESATVAHDVRAWCLERGDNPKFRIALCGYGGEGHEDLERAGWSALNWKTGGGYGSQGNDRGRDNAFREVVWFSPHCLNPEAATLYTPEETD